MKFIEKRFIAQEWAAVFGGKDNMHQNFGEGLRHVDTGMRWVKVIQPFQG